jgi:hypothetical protein
MLNSFDLLIISYIQKALYMLPYSDISIEGFPIGEWSWFIAIVGCVEQYLVLRFKKVGK